jgi:hypothetical protein
MVDLAVSTVVIVVCFVRHLPWQQHQLFSYQGSIIDRSHHILAVRDQQLELVSSSTSEFPLEEFEVGLISHGFC